MPLLGLPFPIPSIDTLLSLPFFSVLLAPSLLSTSSLSTSLNLLLFYLTWTTIIWSYSPLTISLVATLAVRVLFYLAPCTLFLLFDTAIPSVSGSVKASGHKALPHAAATSLAPRSRPQPQQQAIRLSKLFAVALLNISLGVLLQVLIDYTLTQILGRSSALRVTAAYPAPWSLAKDLTRGFIVRNTLAYYIHRFILHSRFQRNKSRHVTILGAQTLTALHEEWHHSLRTAVPFAAAFDHPLPYLIGRWIPVYAPAFLFRMHMLSYLLFIAVVSVEEALAHSGYTVLPSTILLQGMARRQEAHLESGGRGNYGPWGLLDWFHATSIGEQDVMDDIRDEAAKRDVAGKVDRAKGEVGGRLRDVGRRMVDGATGNGEEGGSRERSEGARTRGGGRKQT